MRDRENLTQEDVDNCIQDLQSAMQDCAEKYERLLETQGSFADEEMKQIIELGFIVGKSFMFNHDTDGMKEVHGDILTVKGYEIGSHVKVKFSSKRHPEKTNYGLYLENIKKYPERLIKQEEV